MKILHAVHDFLPEQVAGVEVYTDRLTRALAADHEVGLLYARMDSRLADRSLHRERRDGRLLYALVNNHREHRFEDAYANPALRNRLCEVLDEFDPDVLHVQHLINLSTDLVTEARRRRVPVVMTLHEHWLACANGGQRLHPTLGRCEVLDARRCGECTAHLHGLGLAARGALQRRAVAAAQGSAEEPGEAVAEERAGDRGTDVAAPGEAVSRLAVLKRGARWAERRVARLGVGAQTRRIVRRWDAMRELGAQVDLFIAPSAHLGRLSIDFGLPAERVLHSDYGFPAEGFERRTDLPDRARRFVYLGSLVRHKGLHHLVDAFSRLPEDARLDIHGSQADDPGYCAELRAGAKHPGICFRGECAPEDVPGALAAADCVVAPSVWFENSPLVIHEAFLSGVPVVASQIGGQTELLASGGGLLYPADDPAALARRLVRLYTEPGLLRELATSIPPVKSMREHADELASHYARLAARPR